MAKSASQRVLVVFGSYIDTSPNVYIFDRAFDATILSFYEPKLTGNIDQAKTLSFGERKLPFLFWPWKLFIRTVRLFNLISKKKITVVVSQFDQANVSALPAMFLCRLFGKKVRFFAFLRAGREEYESKDFALFLLKFFVKHFYGFFDRVITVSRGNKQMIEKDFGLRNVTTIYNATSLDYAIKRAAEKVDISKIVGVKNPFVFVSIGRLKEQKCYWSLVRCFRSVVDKNPRAVLLILGQGSQEKALRDLVRRLDLKKHVYLLGYQENVFSFIAAADCFVLTPLWESFGVVVLESLALSTPVICADAAGPREILAPELSIGKSISYPYFGKHGILTPVLERRIRFTTLDEEPLDDGEQVTANVLADVSLDVRMLEKYRHGEERSKDFEIDTIAREYKKVFFSHR